MSDPESKEPEFQSLSASVIVPRKLVKHLRHQLLIRAMLGEASEVEKFCYLVLKANGEI